MSKQRKRKYLQIVVTFFMHMHAGGLFWETGSC